MNGILLMLFARIGNCVLLSYYAFFLPNMTTEDVKRNIKKNKV